MPRTASILAALALAVSTAALAQVPVRAGTAQVNVSQEVLQLAPQLLAFAGSEANFLSLVNGLASGLPVTLTTITPEGVTQTASFTPAGTLTALQIAQILESARQSLIARGVGAPTAPQLAAALAGGALATPIGSVQVAGVLPITPPTVAGLPSTAGAAAARGASVAPVAAAGGPAAASAGTAAVPRFTSDTPTLRSTSESPIPPASVSTVPGTIVAPNGSPSPAAQMQIRR